jgi:hypothetical protein
VCKENKKEEEENEAPPFPFSTSYALVSHSSVLMAPIKNDSVIAKEEKEEETFADERLRNPQSSCVLSTKHASRALDERTLW